MVTEQYRFFKKSALSRGGYQRTTKKLAPLLDKAKLTNMHAENCFYVVTDSHLSSEDLEKLEWIFRTPMSDDVSKENWMDRDCADLVIEIGPRLNFSTAFSTNSVSICRSIGLSSVKRIESSTIYFLTFADHIELSQSLRETIVSALHDHMTHCEYKEPIKSFHIDIPAMPVFQVDIMNEGRKALEKASHDLGLAFDDWDLSYYSDLFRTTVKRNPTSVECFDLAQSNSEHSRHWFFRGRFVIDGVEQTQSLFDLIKATQTTSNDNIIIKFSDNSSAIRGFDVTVMEPTNPGQPSSMATAEGPTRHIIFTAETHNFPTGVAPFPGATTGTGGRIRDVQATGRGAYVVAGTAGYCFGNLHIPGYDLPWEEPADYPPNFAPPLQIAIEASNGASDYGNKFGEPIIAGFARSFGMTVPNGERREYVKPVMFSGGLGSLSAAHVKKMPPSAGMDVVKIGGPAYRIGVGGGAASSVSVQGDNRSDLDLGAVQRGDAEMEQKMNRVIRACVELGHNNPILSIHDQGAGGNGNVLKELVEPAGALIRTSAFALGDPTLSVLEIWGAEYQESNAALVQHRDRVVVERIGARERCDVSAVGEVTGDGKMRLMDDRGMEQPCSKDGKQLQTKPEYAVDLDLELVLGKMPRKVFEMKCHRRVTHPLSLPESLSVHEALSRVLRLPSVASKRYLTNKVDRSVSGLIAQQQCVGPLHTPLADVAVTALSHFSTVGSATAIGEQPVKGLVDSAAGARMSVGEALTNLVFAPVTSLRDVKCSGNWMWAAKLDGEGAELHSACVAMCAIMGQLGIAIDGGKDSLSMAARVGTQTVKAPGTLVISAYVGCSDITNIITPDLKVPDPTNSGCLLHISFGRCYHRLGGSALAQCYGQLGHDVPDMDDADIFMKAFNATQQLINDGLLTAGHDISDGGLVTCILEMAFAGNCGVNVNISAPKSASLMEALFNEELGIVVETREKDLETVKSVYAAAGVSVNVIGQSLQECDPAKRLIEIGVNDQRVVVDNVAALRDIWEETSFQLEMLQTNNECAAQERDLMKCHRLSPYYALPHSWNTNISIPDSPRATSPRVAVIREEGSNGDREMAAAFTLAGFEAWDVNMQDLLVGSITLERFRGVVFVGGFSYADVCGSAKGWAATVMFNPELRAQFDDFRSRLDTFSLGVCNGCQLMALLGWVAPYKNGDTGNGACQQGVFLDHNLSERFESRFPSVCIKKSPSIMLSGLEGTFFGMWVAHGEGYMRFRDDETFEDLEKRNLLAIRFVDDGGNDTEIYPHNPNGSPGGVAGLCSQDGRHLALMPHPERCVLRWQCPYIPYSWDDRVIDKFTPWIKIFTNAYDWCLATGNKL